ncbi:MAG: DUF2092 domain-containing protein [Planctomycetota bacterium]|jgi:hypothetical protein
MTDDVTRRRISPVPTVGLLLIPLLTACARAPDDDGVITGPPVADLQQRPRDVEARADEPGKTVHVMTERSVSLARPDRLYVEDHDDFSRNRFWFDSGRLTALRGSAERYAVVEVPATVDRMLDYLFEEHGLVMPVADFLVGEPYEVLSGGIETGAYLGVTTVSGDACHHLAFRQEHLDWQLWVEARDTRVVPRKFVITYTNEPGDPQFTAVFEDWDLAAEFPDGNFEVILPDGVERVSLETLTGAEP